MAIEIEKTKNRNGGPIFLILIIVIVVIFFVFLSVRNNLGERSSSANIDKIIDKDTKELENVSKNLDKNIDSIFGRSDFQQLYQHNDLNMDFEIGKENPFNSF
jgi:hypothetical protein